MNKTFSTLDNEINKMKEQLDDDSFNILYMSFLEKIAENNVENEMLKELEKIKFKLLERTNIYPMQPKNMTIKDFMTNFKPKLLNIDCFVMTDTCNLLSLNQISDECRIKSIARTNETVIMTVYSLRK